MSISVRHVSKRFGDFLALDGVSLEVDSGSLKTRVSWSLDFKRVSP